MIIAIDPGSISGGIAWSFSGKIRAEKMPPTPKDIYNFLVGIKCKAHAQDNAIVCYVERVGGYVKGNSGPSATTFARHVGNLEMALLASGIAHHWVLPSKWMLFFIGKPKYPPSMKASQRKTRRKNLIKVKAQGLYPGIKVTLNLADALGILNYGEFQEK